MKKIHTLSSIVYPPDSHLNFSIRTGKTTGTFDNRRNTNKMDDPDLNEAIDRIEIL